MSCCGQHRQQFHGLVQRHPAARSSQAASAPPRPTRHAAAYFEYRGNTGLTVLGPITGKRYRFDRHGARVAVDLRDRPSLAAVPNLRQVSNP